MLHFRHNDGDTFVDLIQLQDELYSVSLNTTAEGMIWEQSFTAYAAAVKRYLLAIVDEAHCWGSEVEQDALDQLLPALR